VRRGVRFAGGAVRRCRGGGARFVRTPASMNGSCGPIRAIFGKRYSHATRVSAPNVGWIRPGSGGTFASSITRLGGGSSGSGDCGKGAGNRFGMRTILFRSPRGVGNATLRICALFVCDATGKLRQLCGCGWGKAEQGLFLEKPVEGVAGIAGVAGRRGVESDGRFAVRARLSVGDFTGYRDAR
jgi:hypothetical protein